MSTGLNCEIVEVKPGEWYYLLEDGSAPKQTWDWREFATGYGPFATDEIAHAHLRAYHANPGGHMRLPYEEGRQLSETVQELVAAAPENTAQLMKRTYGVDYDPRFEQVREFDI